MGKLCESAGRKAMVSNRCKRMIDRLQNITK